MKPETKLGAKSFQATLERGRNNLNWVIVPIPFDVAKTWGKRGMIKVKGDINGFAFRTSLFPTGKGDHVLLVNKRMQAGAGVSVGINARFRLEPDTEKRVAAMPPELERELAQDRELRGWYDRLNYSMRKWICDWITDVKNAEACARRAGLVAERLLATMYAERDLPPVLRVAFSRNPRAFEGWKRMSPTHRRGHLFAIFSYRSPEARARRVAKVVQDAYGFAERAGKKKAGES